MAHTPGPWNTGGIASSGSDYRRQTVSIWGPTPKGKQSGEWIAKDVSLQNAPIISKAPKLLDACKAALSLMVVADTTDMTAADGALFKAIKWQLQVAVEEAEGRR